MYFHFDISFHLFCVTCGTVACGTVALQIDKVVLPAKEKLRFGFSIMRTKNILIRLFN